MIFQLSFLKMTNRSTWLVCRERVANNLAIDHVGVGSACQTGMLERCKANALGSRLLLNCDELVEEVCSWAGVVRASRAIWQVLVDIGRRTYIKTLTECRTIQGCSLLNEWHVAGEILDRVDIRSPSSQNIELSIQPDGCYMVLLTHESNLEYLHHRTPVSRKKEPLTCRIVQIPPNAIRPIQQDETAGNSLLQDFQREFLPDCHCLAISRKRT